MSRESTLARFPPLLAAHRLLMRWCPAEYALADLYTQAARSAVVHRRPPWRDAASDLPGPYRRGSDTLFVLGGGGSINLLPAGAWDEIAAADSLGINFWLLHEFVPTGYVQEWIEPVDDPVQAERLAVRREILDKRRDEIGDAAVFFRTPARRRRHGRALTPSDVSHQLGHPASQVTVTFDLNLLPLPLEPFCRTLALASRLGLLRPRARWRYLPTARGTVLWTLLFALRMGYRKVVLCGIDLHDTRYFYEDPDAAVPSGLPIPPNVQQGSVHRTNDPTEPGPTMQEIVPALDRGLLARAGLSVEVGHESSLLARSVPVHRWAARPADEQSS